MLGLSTHQKRITHAKFTKICVILQKERFKVMILPFFKEILK